MSEWPEGLEQQKADYEAGLWCGECRYHVVEEPPCCWPPSAPVSSSSGSETDEGWPVPEGGCSGALCDCDPDGEPREAVWAQAFGDNAAEAWAALTSRQRGSVIEALTPVADSEVVAAVTAERERADAERRSEQDLMHADLSDLLTALGMGTHARPESPHQVMQQAIAHVRELAGLRERIEALADEWHSAGEKVKRDRVGVEGAAWHYGHGVAAIYGHCSRSLRALGSATKTGEGT